MSVSTTLPRRVLAATALTLVLVPAGCGTGHPPQLLDSDSSRSAVATAPTDPRGQLAGLVAAAQDRRYIVAYTLVSHGHADRTVLVSVATDSSWRVDVPGGALSGGADVSIIGDRTGTYQCLLGGSATRLASAATTPGPGPGPGRGSSVSPGLNAPIVYVAPACVKVAPAGHLVPRRYDPIIEHLFTDWLDVLIDRGAPISVFTASPLAHSTGACFSVQPSAASLVPPVASGVYCFAPDGTMTAAAIAGNSLWLSGVPAPPPPSNTLPAPITHGPAAPTKAPPVPAATQ